MIQDLEKLNIYVKPGHTDMRKQINGLAVIVEKDLAKDPFSGALFMFCNKQRKLLKILYWDKNGFCLWLKRLEKDRFPWPKTEGEALEISIEQIEDTPPAPKARDKENTGNKKGGGRKPISSDIPREEVLCELSCKEKACPHCQKERPEIGRKNLKNCNSFRQRLLSKNISKLNTAHVVARHSRMMMNCRK